MVPCVSLFFEQCVCVCVCLCVCVCVCEQFDMDYDFFLTPKTIYLVYGFVVLHLVWLGRSNLMLLWWYALNNSVEASLP